MTSQITPLMDSTQVAGLLKCSERTVEDHARAGRLPAVKFGDGWMFPTEALLRAVNRMAEDEAARRAKPAQQTAIKFTTPVKKGRPDLSILTALHPG
jgi:excisionase family DNA binding protein